MGPRNTWWARKPRCLSHGNTANLQGSTWSCLLNHMLGAGGETSMHSHM